MSWASDSNHISWASASRVIQSIPWPSNTSKFCADDPWRHCYMIISQLLHLQTRQWIFCEPNEWNDILTNNFKLVVSNWHTQYWATSINTIVRAHCNLLEIKKFLNFHHLQKRMSISILQGIMCQKLKKHQQLWNLFQSVMAFLISTQLPKQKRLKRVWLLTTYMLISKLAESR